MSKNRIKHQMSIESIRKSLESNGFEVITLGDICALGFIEALKNIPVGIGRGRKVLNEDLYNFFLDRCNLNEIDLDPYIFSYLLMQKITDGEIPCSPIWMGEKDNSEYEELEGIDVELLNELFVKQQPPVATCN